MAILETLSPRSIVAQHAILKGSVIDQTQESSIPHVRFQVFLSLVEAASVLSLHELWHHLRDDINEAEAKRMKNALAVGEGWGVHLPGEKFAPKGIIRSQRDPIYFIKDIRLRLLEYKGLGACSGLDLTSSRLLVGLVLLVGVHIC